MLKKLDTADGNQNGQIDASIWNEFIGEIGTGKEIKELISTVAAMNSITAYVIRKAKELNKNIEELANMNPKPKIEEGHDEACDWKKVKLPQADGKSIGVYYNKKGEISSILINHDTTPDHFTDGTTYEGTDIFYNATKAQYNTDHSMQHFEGSISSGYNFEALKTLAKKNFGEKE